MEKYNDVRFVKASDYETMVATDVVHLIPRKKGEFVTRKQQATVKYDFTEYDESVLLTVDGQAFDEEDIDDLILFLEKSKKEIQRRIAKKLRQE